MAAVTLPPEMERIRDLARRAVSPLKAAGGETNADKDLLFSAKRLVGSEGLPPHQLLYFLLVELLGFRNLGRFEKIDWSVPLDFEGVAYLVEHRKFGIGVFARDDDAHRRGAAEVARLLKRGVRCAQPFFRRKADEAIRASQINVVNNSAQLFDRYCYFKLSYETKLEEAKRRRQERIVTHHSETSWSVRFPYHDLAREVSWLAMAAIDAFFAWTEHAFVHLAILQGRIVTGEDFTAVAGIEWGGKFKRALDVDDSATKAHFDAMMLLRRRVRNVMTHGAFGNDGEAFSFHSSAGPVPVGFDRSGHKSALSLTPGLRFDEAKTMRSIETFITHMWAGPRAAARIYIQDSHLPIIMTMAADGTYADAMQSPEAMEAFVRRLGEEAANMANMDW